MKLISACSLLLLSVAEVVTALGPSNVVTRRQWLKRQTELEKRDVAAPDASPKAYNFSVPIDHFQNDTRYAPHTTDKFNLRYYFDASHYKPGGPVIILEGGETSVVGRIPFLQKGLIAQLANATNGIAVIIEHRYYGTSIPVPNLSNENFRFLTTEQALADVAYYAKNIKFPGLENVTLTAPTTPWIVYGGSYAGGMAAFLRKQYPDVFWGAIASSGVVEAIYDYWKYFEPISQFGPQDCVNTTKKFTNVADNILLKSNNSETIKTLKNAFGLGNLTHNGDFGNQLAQGIYNWQSRNWDPEVNSPAFDIYCGIVTNDSLVYPETEAYRATAQELIKAGGWGEEVDALTTRFLNYMGYTNTSSAQPCLRSNQTLDECYSAYNADIWKGDDISQWGLKSWNWQYCTEWGYLQTGDVPADQLPLISRTIDLPYTQLSCSLPFNITAPPDLERVNRYGGFNISYNRLAFVDGQADPWRPATTHADEAPKRVSTTDEPFLLIEGAVHHWDENGLYPNETTPTLPPQPVVEAQQAELEFVQAWLKEWEAEKGGY